MAAGSPQSCRRRPAGAGRAHRRRTPCRRSAYRPPSRAAGGPAVELACRAAGEGRSRASCPARRPRRGVRKPVRRASVGWPGPHSPLGRRHYAGRRARPCCRSSRMRCRRLLRGAEASARRQRISTRAEPSVDLCPLAPTRLRRIASWHPGAMSGTASPRRTADGRAAVTPTEPSRPGDGFFAALARGARPRSPNRRIGQPRSADRPWIGETAAPDSVAYRPGRN